MLHLMIGIQVNMTTNTINVFQQVIRDGDTFCLGKIGNKAF